MKTLVLADIHANLPALQAVLEDAGKCDRIVFLGDLANFGPHPEACVDLLKEYDPICIIGNHDEQIVSETPKNFWDKWSRKQLRSEQLGWIASFQNSLVLDGHILLVHGAYNVDYDILPNTPDEDVKFAFEEMLTPGIDQVWFGHYHYQVDRMIDGVEYHCIRPVGHHRDKDTRASYSVYEDGRLVHKRVAYDVEKTVRGIYDCGALGDKTEVFVEMLRNGFHPEALKKDLIQMQKNEERAGR